MDGEYLKITEIIQGVKPLGNERDEQQMWWQRIVLGFNKTRFAKPTFKVFITLFFTATTTILLKLVPNLLTPQGHEIILRCLAIVSILFNIFLQVLYASSERTFQVENALIKNELENYRALSEKALAAFRHRENRLVKAHTSVISIVRTFSDLLYKYQKVHQAFDFKRLCDEVCNEVYVSLPTGGEDLSDFEVSFVAIKGSANRKTNLISYKNHDNTAPTILDCLSQEKKYFFQKIAGAKNEIVVLESRELIQKNFYFSSTEKRENCKYMQYVAIPVYCKSKKPIGILQLSTFIPDGFGLNRDEIVRFIKTAIQPLATFALLADKTMKIVV